MAENPAVPTELVTAALAASPGIEHFYVAGGGSVSDLRTDMSAALAVVRAMAVVAVDQGGGIVIDLVERRVRDEPFVGRDRRQASGR